MRVLNRTLAVVSLVLVGALAGCGADIKSKVMCSTDSDCITNLMCDTDAAVGTAPQCCAGVCVIQSLGCDSGYRYLTFDPSSAPFCNYGECISDPMCPVMPDLLPADDLTSTAPVDLAPAPDMAGTD